MNENVYKDPIMRQIKLEDAIKNIQYTYVTKEYVENNILKIDGEGINVGSIATKTDLESYTTTEELEQNYPTKTLLEQNYATKTELEGYVTEDELDEELEDYATVEYVNGITNPNIDVEDLVPKTQIFEDGDTAKSIVIKTDATGDSVDGISVNIVGDNLPDNNKKNILIGAGSAIYKYSADADFSYDLEDDDVPLDSINMSRNTVIGLDSTITQGGANNVVIGNNCTAYDTFSSVVVGNSAMSKRGFGIAIGDWAINDQRFGIAIGQEALNQDVYGIAIGQAARNNSEYGISIGQDITNDGISSTIAIGKECQVCEEVECTLSIGYKAGCNGDHCIAIGSEAVSGNSTSDKGNGIAIGRNAKATGENSITIGCTSTTELNNSTDGSVIIGASSTTNSVKFGPNTLQLSQANGITFTENPKVNENVAPSVANDIITKKYVDDRIVKNPDTTTNTIKLGDTNTTKLVIGGYYISFSSTGVIFGTSDKYVEVPFDSL
jgi:hypothetical protein